MLEEDLGEDELTLLGRFIGIENKDIHSLGGRKCGDHTLGRGGTWISETGPDRNSEITCRQTLYS